MLVILGSRAIFLWVVSKSILDKIYNFSKCDWSESDGWTDPRVHWFFLVCRGNEIMKYQELLIMMNLKGSSKLNIFVFFT